MAQFAEAVEGLADACSVPGKSRRVGNVSFYNETNGRRSSHADDRHGRLLEASIRTLSRRSVSSATDRARR